VARARRPAGQLLLDRLFGAEIRFIPTQDPYDPRGGAGPGSMISWPISWPRGACKTHVLHLPGRTGTLGAAAMV
jgi:hypothetical protein